MRIDVLFGIYSSLFVVLFINTTWKAIDDQILSGHIQSGNAEDIEHNVDRLGQPQWSLSLDQITSSPHFPTSQGVNANTHSLARPSLSGRRARVFYRGLKQTSAFIFSFNDKPPALLDVIWDDTGPPPEISTVSEFQSPGNLLAEPIIVTSSTLPAPGDKLYYSWAYNQATFDMITPPGFDLSWDFSGLAADENITEEYLSPSDGVYSSRFPDANLMTRNADGEERYFVVSSSGLRLIGFTENTLFGEPFSVVYDYTRNGLIPNAGLNERFTPLNFFDTYSQSAGFLEGYSFSELPPALRNAYLAAGLTTTDSVRLRYSYTNFSSVSANGTLTIPGQNGQYPVLRMQTTQYREARIDAHVIPLGWLDITDLTIQYFPASNPSLGIDTIGAHKFFNDVTKEEIAWITLSSQGLPSHVRFKNNSPTNCFDPDLVNPTLNGDPISPGTYMASETITSGGRVATGTTVQFNAGIQISLEPTFTAELGSTFIADVITCPENKLPAVPKERTKVAVVPSLRGQ